MQAKNSFDLVHKLGVVFKLSHYINKNMLFKFLPVNSTKKVGGKISYRVPVALYNLKFKNFVEFDQRDEKSMLKYQQFSQQNPLRIPIKPFSFSSTLIHLKLGGRNKFHWKLVPMRLLEEEQQKNAVKYLGLVTLRHTETEGHITSDISYTNDEKR